MTEIYFPSNICALKLGNFKIRTREQFPQHSPLIYDEHAAEISEGSNTNCDSKYLYRFGLGSSLFWVSYPAHV